MQTGHRISTITPWHAARNISVRSTMGDTIAYPSPPVLPPISSIGSALELLIEFVLQPGIPSLTRFCSFNRRTMQLSTRTTSTPQSSNIVLTSTTPLSVSSRTPLTMLTLYRAICTPRFSTCNCFSDYLWWRITSCARPPLWWDRSIDLCVTIHRPVWRPLDLVLLPMTGLSFGLELPEFFEMLLPNIRKKCHELLKTDASLTAQFFKMVDRHWEYVTAYCWRFLPVQGRRLCVVDVGGLSDYHVNEMTSNRSGFFHTRGKWPWESGEFHFDSFVLR